MVLWGRFTDGRWRQRAGVCQRKECQCQGSVRLLSPEPHRELAPPVRSISMDVGSRSGRASGEQKMVTRWRVCARVAFAYSGWMSRIRNRYSAAGRMLTEVSG